MLTRHGRQCRRACSAIGGALAESGAQLSVDELPQSGVKAVKAAAALRQQVASKGKR
jgi:hypothetical protein